MSARKPSAIAAGAAAAAAAVSGAKPDNNNVASPTRDIFAIMHNEAGAAATVTLTAAVEAAAGTGSGSGSETAVADVTVASDVDAPPATDDALLEPAKESVESEKAGQKQFPSPLLVMDSGSPRKDLSGLGGTKNLRITRHSSPLLLGTGAATTAATAASGASSDSEELPSSSSSGSQRKGSADRQIIRGRKSIKELREAVKSLAKDEATVETDSSTIAAAEEKEPKDTKDYAKPATDREKDSKEKETTPTPSAVTASPAVAVTSIAVVSTPTPAPAPAPAPCNRVTRKAHAQELALANNNTRVTRNRRQSSTVNNEPQLPARGRRKKPVQQLLKRKRSGDESESAPALKYSKIEVKEDDYDHDSSVASLGNDEATPAKSTPSLSIKLEPQDSEESSPAQPQSASRRGRGRPQTRVTPAASSVTSATSNTPTTTSTRATRHSKAGSPCLLAATPTEPTPTGAASKRRRVGSSNRSLLVAKATSASSSSLAASSHGGAVGDEDSKDSLASSSMDDLLLAAVEIKQEKMTIDFDESLDAPVVTKLEPEPEPQPVSEPAAEPVESGENVRDAATTASSNGIEPLTVDTETEVKTPLPEDAKEATKAAKIEIEAEDAANEAGKAPSLSPEMISEGVSAISVKQFYKKPEFLANNLGIEKDPELGEIVQIVTETQIQTAAAEVKANADAEADAEAEPQIETEPEAKTKSEVVAELETEAEMEAKLDDSHTTTMGELRVDESGDETELEKALTDPAEEPAAETDVEADPEAEVEVAAEAEAEAELAAEEAESSPGELNGEIETVQSKADDYDDFESEIMEQLAKEGVVDASGNALSASKQQIQLLATENDTDEATIECDTLKIEEQEQPDGTDAESEVQEQEQEHPQSVDNPNPAKTQPEMVITLEMAPYTEEQEAEANAEVDDEDTAMQLLNEDCAEAYPEENKENVSTEATTEAASCESSMDIDLAFKAETDAAKLEKQLVDELQVKPELEDEEKPLAAVAAEQKTASASLATLKLKANGKDDDADADGDGEDDLSREKELHLQHLGLLTHQAAEQLRQEYIQEAHTRAVHQQQLQQQQSGKRSAAKSGGGGGGGGVHIESSGTLKTVIKLNRSSNGGAGGASGVPTGTVIHGAAAGAGNGANSSSMGSATRKAGLAGAVGNPGGGGGGGSSSSAHGVRRQSLKMTFQKGRARGHGAADRAADQHGAHGAEDSYYTIQNENEGASKSGNTAAPAAGRKTTNRLSSTNHSNNNNLQQKQQQQQQQHGQHNNASRVCLDSSHSEGHGGQPAEQSFYQMVKKDEKEKILIPEKASSFKFHPGRLCEDQCYYCSGKFGLYDTPCHVGQIKSVERQQKILANEEKLTVDNCLCDACFRHVDRRANAPSYKKRISAPGHLESGNSNNSNTNSNNSNADKHFGGGVDAGDQEFATTSAGAAAAGSGAQRVCAVKDCAEGASHSLRRKCVRKSVKKCLLNFEIPVGTSSVWLCEPHYNTVIQSSGCVLCKRRLGKNHMYHINSDTDRLEKALAEMGILVQLGVGTAVCKLCRYFANLLMKPPDSTKSQKAEFVKNYRKRLLKVHNLQDGSNEVSEADEEEMRATTSTATATGTSVDEACTELPMIVDYDGPTDSNSSSSSMGASTSKQMSKLQAILQQNLAGEQTPSTGKAKAVAAAATGVVTGAAAGAASGGAADISSVLRGNPNISMRELFHGEEDLGVQFKVPFGCSSSQRTPEGWTRVQTFLQYDEPTRRLWEELQKPYGNQSSFLRHLILLEKYYRNGDLVLAPHASPNATVYTETVRQRLNSYDHGHCGGLGQSQTKSNSQSPNAQVNAHASSPVQLNASSNATAASGSVLANALTTSPHASSGNSEPSANQSAEAVIPLVELNDDDDDEEEDNNNDNDKGEVSYYTPELNRLHHVTVDKLTKQLSSNAVTIIARPKESANKPAAPEETPPKHQQLSLSGKDAPPLVATNSSSNNSSSSAANSRSILKTNLLNKAVEILPLASQQSQSQSQSQPQQSNHKPASAAGSAEKPHKLLDMANQLVRNHIESQASKHKALPTAAGNSVLQPATPKPTANVAQLLSSPPELISLQRRRTSGATGSTGGGGVATAAVSVSATSLTATAISASASLPTLGGKRLQLPRTGSGGVGAGAGGASGGAPSVIMLPDSLTPQERHDSKSWKPTLIPLKEQHKVISKSSTLFQTADGRRLPAQVQVQSGGKPYLISIIDYNRMCILRREKLMRDQMLKANAKAKPGQPQSQMQHQAQQQQLQQQQQQQHQQQQQQTHSSYSAGLSSISKMAAAQTARLQLHQLQHQQQKQLPTLQPGGVAGGANCGLRLARLAPKPMPPLSNPQNAGGTSTGGNTATSTQSTNYQPMLVNALAAAAAAVNNASVDSHNSWLWKNFPDATQYLLNGNGNGSGSSVAAAASKLPHLTTKPTSTATSGGGGGGGITYTLKQQQQQQQQQKLIDNVIMSKIPKSLTVIPQHMAGGGSGGASGGGDMAGGSKD